MPIERIPTYPIPDGTDDYAQRLVTALEDEATLRVLDFDILKLSNVPWIDVRTYGAVQDSSTDNAVAFQAAAAAMVSGSVLYIPDTGTGGYYDFSSGFSITQHRAKLICDGQLRYTGTSGVAITLSTGYRMEAKIRLYKKYVDWTDACTGVRISGIRNSVVTIIECRRFAYGLEFYGAVGAYYNNFFLQDMDDNKIALHFNGGAGTMNANSFYGGRFYYSSNVNGEDFSGCRTFYMPVSSINGNTFYSPRFEAHTAKQVQNYIYCGGRSNVFVAPRFEDTCSDTPVRFITGSRDNVFLGHGSDFFDETNLNFYYGAGESKIGKIRIKSFTGHDATYQLWNTGDRWFNYGYASIVHSPGKICTKAGYYGPAITTTASTTNGSAEVTLSVVSDILVGSYINIVGVTGDKKVISRDCINDKITIGVVADATVT